MATPSNQITALPETTLPARRPSFGSSDHEGIEESAPEGIPLRFYVLYLARYRNAIVAFVLAMTFVATLIALGLPREYISSAVLRVDPQGAHTVGDSSESTVVQQSARELVATEAQEVTSPAVVTQTIQALGLDQQAEFSPEYAKAVAQHRGLTREEENRVQLRVANAIGVSQPLGTFLLNVSFRSRSPELAMKAANQLVQSLIARDYDSRVQALMGSSHSMQAQVNELRANMEKSQKALVDYESQNDVLSPDSKDNIVQSRLDQVNNGLGEAQAERMALEASYGIVASNDLDALLATKQGAGLVPLHARLLADQARLAQDAQVYGPDYPLYRQQAALVAHDEQVLTQQQQHIARQIEAAYLTAKKREDLLRAELQNQKQRMNEFNLKAIRYNALKASADSYTTLYFQLQQRIQDVSVAANLHSEMVRVISPAEVNEKPVFPRPLLTAILTFLLASVIGCGAAVGYGMMDRRIASPEQIERWLQLPTLATLPRIEGEGRFSELQPQLLSEGAAAGAELDAGGGAVAPFRESILGLHSALSFAQPGGVHVMSVTSSMPGEGKSTIAARLATVYADLKQRVILVDADMRKPSVHRLFQLRNQVGLSSVLKGTCSLDDALQVPGASHYLTLLPAGPPTTRPVDLLHFGFGALLDQLRERFEYVIVDCPPVLGFADALAVGNLVEGVIVVAKAGQTDRAKFMNTLRVLRTARAQPLGVVLNGMDKQHGAYYGYYQHYQEYYRRDGDEEE